MNEFMEVFNEHGWTVYYFAGLVTGVIISIFVGFFVNLVDCINEFLKELREKKVKKNEKL